MDDVWGYPIREMILPSNESNGNGLICFTHPTEVTCNCRLDFPTFLRCGFVGPVDTKVIPKSPLFLALRPSSLNVQGASNR